MTKEATIGSTEVNGMAYIGMIVSINPIDGADRIDAAVVDCINGLEFIKSLPNFLRIRFVYPKNLQTNNIRISI